jgi:hypothetical protein
MSSGIVHSSALYDLVLAPSVQEQTEFAAVNVGELVPFDTVYEAGYHGDRIHVFSYEHDNLTQMLTMRAIDGVWTTEEGVVLTYTTSGRLATRTDFSHRDACEKTVESYAYDQDGRRTAYHCVFYSGNVKTPTYDYLDTCAYNVQGQWVYQMTRLWTDGKLRFGYETVASFADTVTIFTTASWERGEWVDRWRDISSGSMESGRWNWRAQIWNGAAWVEDRSSIETYDDRMRLLTASERRWLSGTWIDTYRRTYVYGTLDPLVNEGLGEVWDGSTWMIEYKDRWTTDVMGRTLTYASQLWRDGHASEQRGVFDYGADGAERQLDSTWTDGTLMGFSRYLTGASGLDHLWEQFWWSETDGVWVGSQQATAYTAGGHETERYSRTWYNGSWHPDTRYLFTYDDAERIRSLRFFVGSNDQWIATRDVRLDGGVIRSGDWAFYGWNSDWIWFNGFYELSFGYRAAVSGVAGPNDEKPEHSTLTQNYPNPFNPTTTIPFTVAAGARTTIAIYDVLGCEVARPVDEWKDPGEYRIEFDARGLASGMYICRFTAGSVTQTQKLMLVR